MFDIDKLKKATPLDAEIAKYILDNLNKVAYMRVRDLADNTHVSPATIVRFTQKMGYSSFPEMRLMLKQELAKREKILDNDSQRESLVTSAIFPRDIERKVTYLVNRLTTADFVHCIGLGASGIMADYAARQLSTLGYRSFSSKTAYIPYLEKMKNRVSSQKEICLFFSVSGETIELIHSAKMLNDSQFFSVSITNNEGNTLSQTTNLAINYDTSFDRVAYNADLSSQLPVVYLIEKIVKQLYQLEQQEKAE